MRLSALFASPVLRKNLLRAGSDSMHYISSDVNWAITDCATTQFGLCKKGLTSSPELQKELIKRYREQVDGVCVSGCKRA